MPIIKSIHRIPQSRGPLGFQYKIEVSDGRIAQVTDEELMMFYPQLRGEMTDEQICEIVKSLEGSDYLID